MVHTTIASGDILAAADDLVKFSRQILKEASLTRSQRDDFEAIQDSAAKFQEDIHKALQELENNCSADEWRTHRHQLRNHLNIVSGFAGLLIRDLPDNLLLYMILVRKILATSEMLQSTINAID